MIVNSNITLTMSFLLQTNADFIKFQLRSLLLDPDKKKELKKKLGKLGLYNNRKGFVTYRDFFKTELARPSNTRKSRREGSNQVSPNRQRTREKTYTKSALPSLSMIKPPKNRGILATDFFKKSRIAISASVLYNLISKIYIPQPPENLKINLRSRYDKDFDLKFIPYYLGSFISVANNIPRILIGSAMAFTVEVKKSISNAYIGICSVYGINRKVYIRNKDTRLVMYLDPKQWAGIIAETLNKFFHKKYPLLNEVSFEEFIGNYLFTHNTTNQKRLCFELYDRLGLQYLTSKHIFVFFESPIFPLIKNDLFVMINYLSNDRYTEETAKLRRTSTRIIQSEIFKIIASEPKRLNFKTFCKLTFEQKFPDMLLAVAYTLFDEIGCEFLTNYYSVPKYRVSFSSNSTISVLRPLKFCKDYLKIVKSYSIMIKSDINDYLQSHKYFTKEMLKGCIASFMLGCNAEYLCEFKQLSATISSLRSGSALIFGKHCPLIMERIFKHIAIPSLLRISLWEFVDYIEGFFTVRII